MRLSQWFRPCSRALLLATLLVGGLVPSPAAAADAPLQFDRMELADGKVLHHVVVKSYDAGSDRLLVIADRQARFIPVKLIPNPVAQRLRDTAPLSGQNLSLVAAPPAPGAPAASGPSAATGSAGPAAGSGAALAAAALADRQPVAPSPSPSPVPRPSAAPTAAPAR